MQKIFAMESQKIIKCNTNQIFFDNLVSTSSFQVQLFHKTTFFLFFLSMFWNVFLTHFRVLPLTITHHPCKCFELFFANCVQMLISRILLYPQDQFLVIVDSQVLQLQF
jgi:hypothetical protein